MSALTITLNGQTQVIQLGTLSPAVNQQITQAVTNSAANAATSTEQAGIATSAANTATTQAGIATNAANTATTEAGIATTQAGIATGAASAATTEAAAALASQNAAAASAADADTSASSASTTAAAMQAALSQFKAVYLGELASDPTVDGNGNPLLAGAEYFNTTEGKLRIYSGTAWGDYDTTAQTASANATLAASQAAGSAGAAASSASQASASQQAAATSESNAGTSAAQANSAAGSASGSATAAANSASLVQSIQSALGPYPSSGATIVPSGVAASAMYWVVNTTTGGIDLYKNNAGTPQAQGVSLATQAAIQALNAMLYLLNLSANGDQRAWSVLDQYGFQLAEILKDGSLNTPALTLGKTTLSTSGTGNNDAVSVDSVNGITAGQLNAKSTAGGLPMSLIGSYGFVGGLLGSYVRPDGVLMAATPVSSAQDDMLYRARNADNVAAANRLKEHYNNKVTFVQTGYNHILTNGQSNSCGYQAWPGISRTNYDGNVMMGLCVGTSGGAGVYTFSPVGSGAFTPLVAVPAWPKSATSVYTDADVAGFTPGSTYTGETIVEGFANNAKRLLNMRSSVTTDPSRIMIGTTVGIGGFSIAGLLKSASPSYWGRVTGAATQAKTNAGSTAYQVMALQWDQGEADSNVTPSTTYQANLNQYYNDATGDLMAISGQKLAPPMYCTSVGSYLPGSGTGTAYAAVNQVPQAQLNLGLARPDEIFVVGPRYPVTDLGIHMDNNGNRWLAAQYAKVWYLTQVLRRRWQPLSPRSATLRDSVVAIDFLVPEPPLQWLAWYNGYNAETDADGGFRVGDTFGLIPVLSKRIVFDTIVELTLARNPIGTAYCWYADSTEAGGNLCDSDTWVAGDNYIYQSTFQYTASNITTLVNAPYPLWNWCVPFNLQIQ